MGPPFFPFFLLIKYIGSHATGTRKLALGDNSHHEQCSQSKGYISVFQLRNFDSVSSSNAAITKMNAARPVIIGEKKPTLAQNKILS